MPSHEVPHCPLSFRLNPLAFTVTPLAVKVRILPGVPEVEELPSKVKVLGTQVGVGVGVGDPPWQRKSWWSLNVSSGEASDTLAAITITLPDLCAALKEAILELARFVSLSSRGPMLARKASLKVL